MTNTTFMEEKNAPVNYPCLLYTVHDCLPEDTQYTGSGTNLYIAGYKEDITYNSILYKAYGVSHDAVTENASAEIDSVRFQMTNVSRLIQAYLESYSWLGKKVSIKRIWLNQLDDPNAYFEDLFYIDRYSADRKAATFILTSKVDIMKLLLPRCRYMRNACRFRYKGKGCWTGSSSPWSEPSGWINSDTCNHTLQDCEAHGNKGRFGGFPSIPSRGKVLIG